MSNNDRGRGTTGRARGQPAARGRGQNTRGGSSPGRSGIPRPSPNLDKSLPSTPNASPPVGRGDPTSFSNRTRAGQGLTRGRGQYTQADAGLAREVEAVNRRAAARRYEEERREAERQRAAAIRIGRGLTGKLGTGPTPSLSSGSGGDDNGGDASSPIEPPTTPFPQPADLPVDLPTAYYAALAARPADDAPTTYLNYPARIHHLKYASSVPSPPSSPVELTRHRQPTWEDLHLYQKVSSPRLHMRWTQPATPETTARAAQHFVPFREPQHYTKPFLGLRPYTDILYLDDAYLTAAFAAVDASGLAAIDAVGIDAAEPDWDVLVPFLAAPDRALVRVLAVSAAAVSADAVGSERHTTANRVAGLRAAFPALSHLMLVSVAAIERPASAEWDLETEFARWCPMREVVRVEKESELAVKDYVVGEFATANGLVAVGGPERDVEGERQRGWLEVRVEEALRRDAPRGRPVRAEAVVMLYFRDAFDRATDAGWSPGLDFIDVDHLDLGMA